MKKLPRVLIKIGGAALAADDALDYVSEAVQQYRLDGYQVIVVHGGGPAINAELTRQGLTWEFINGQRKTTPEMMGIIESTLCGQVNSKIIRHFVAHQIPAVGLSGADHKTLLCEAADPALGLVGHVIQVNSMWIEELLRVSTHPVPVIAPIGVDALGQSYNINADYAASRLASALQVDQLIYLTDQDGVLDSRKNIFPSLCESEITNLINSGVISGGMMTKMRAVVSALKNGVPVVRVINGKAAPFACHFNSFHPTEWCGTSCTLDHASRPSVQEIVAHV